MKSLINRIYIFVVVALLLLGASCSQTKKLAEGEVLYTGVKKMKIETAEGVKLEGGQSSAISSPLSYPPNNPLYAPYVRSPFPVGLWVYNWKIKKEKGLKYWLYKKLAKKPVLISDVQPELRLKVVDNAAKDYGYFGVEASYEIIPNKRNPKKAKISYHVSIPKPYMFGNIAFWGWKGRMDSLLQATKQRCLLTKGTEYSVYTMEDERARVTRMLRNNGYYYFQPDYIEFLADTTQEKRVADIRIALKHGVPAIALQPYKIGKVELVLEEPDQSGIHEALGSKTEGAGSFDVLVAGRYLFVPSAEPDADKPCPFGNL